MQERSRMLIAHAIVIILAPLTVLGLYKIGLLDRFKGSNQKTEIVNKFPTRSGNWGTRKYEVSVQLFSDTGKTQPFIFGVCPDFMVVDINPVIGRDPGLKSDFKDEFFYQVEINFDRVFIYNTCSLDEKGDKVSRLEWEYIWSKVEPILKKRLFLP